MSMSNRGAPTPPPPASTPAHNPQSPPTLPILFFELIIEILLRLPVKSLARFRCVSKSWKSLISNPNFIKSHHRRSSANPYLLLLRHPHVDFSSCSVLSLLHNPSSSDAALAQQHDSLPMYIDSPLREYGIVGSCNGLVCLVDSVFEGDTLAKKWICLWNPATKKLKCRNLAYLQTDDYYGYFDFAFGYDRLTDTYKVVAFRAIRQTSHDPDLQKHEIKICSLGDDDASWRDFQSFPITPIRLHLHWNNKAVYFSGAINWLAIRNMSIDDLISNNETTFDRMAILSLDLGNEKYTQWLLPHGFSEEIHRLPHGFSEVIQQQPTLGILRDSLCVCHDYKATDFVIWQMKEFGVDTSWTRLVKLSYDHLQISGLTYDFPLLWMSEKGDVSIMQRGGELYAILYIIGYTQVEHILLPNYSNCDVKGVFVESLIWPCRN